MAGAMTGFGYPAFLVNGPSGVADGPDLNYTHTQVAPSTLWTINHNLGKFPSVSIRDSGGNEVTGCVGYINANSLMIQFSAAFSGTAHLN